MKNKGMMLSLATLLFASATMAQSVETDDMYFNSKDRAALKAQKSLETPSYTASVKKTKKNEVVEEVSVNNPTDSYSARNVNPEYSARSNSETALFDEQDYFVSNFKYKKSSDINQWNNSYSNWYGAPLYSSNYYGSWMNPYGRYNSYGSYYDPYGSNPWGNPYNQSAWCNSYSFYMGNSYNYGWGGYGMGMGLSYGYPYNNYGSGFYNQGYGYSSGYGGYGGYPGSVVIINNNNNNSNFGEAGRPTAYGKRGTRSGMVTTPEQNVNYRTRTNYAAVTGDRPTNTGGRTTQQTEYYNRSWRTSQQSESSYPSRNSTNNTWSSPDRSSSFDNHSRSNSNSGSSFSSPSRSSSFDGGGGGATRSSAPASSGSNGRSRGAD